MRQLHSLKNTHQKFHTAAAGCMRTHNLTHKAPNKKHKKYSRDALDSGRRKRSATTKHAQKNSYRRSRPHAHAQFDTQSAQQKKQTKVARRTRFWPSEALRDNKARAKTFTPPQPPAYKNAIGHAKRAQRAQKKDAKREARRTRIWPRARLHRTRGRQTAGYNPLARRLKNCTTQGI